MDLIQRILTKRQAQSDEQARINNLKQLLAPQQLKDIDKASKRVAEAITQQQSVVIIGDYDVDGATSTALAVRLLEAFGLQTINYVIPNRMTHGYGLSPAVIEIAMHYQPQLIITVDNGISSHRGVNDANEKSVDVIITDHHLAPEVLPNAYAIVNPNQPGCNFASKNLAGVGVCFYLMIAVRQQLREDHWFSHQNIKEPNLANWLDLVALGTVADLVPLDSNNRLLVNKGLQLMRSGQGNMGIKSLYLSSKKASIEHLTCSDLGFAIAPKLNAAGRLEDMSVGIECLLSDNVVVTESITTELTNINIERRQLQKAATDEVASVIEKFISNQNNDILEQMKYSYCLYNRQWHQGIVGLVASKIKDTYNRPTFVFANESNVDNNDDINLRLKGSGRSIKGFHLRDALAEINVTKPNLIESFGGHAMAAGLTINRANLEDFTQALEDYCRQNIDKQSLIQSIDDDGGLKETEITIDNAVLLEQYVWGQGFQEPVFFNSFKVLDQRIMAQCHLRLSLQLDSNLSSSTVYNGVWFNVNNEVLSTTLTSIHCYYQLNVNRFRGDEYLQLMIESVQKYH